MANSWGDGIKAEISEAEKWEKRRLAQFARDLPKEDRRIRAAGQVESERNLALLAPVDVVGRRLKRQVRWAETGRAVAFGKEAVARVFDADFPQQ